MGTATTPRRAEPAALSEPRRALLDRSDSDLVRQHLQGDARAFGALVDRYQTRLLNFVHRNIGDRERAEDIVQDVFIRVFRHLHRFDHDKKFSTWIYTIASNLNKNELRNRSRNPVVLVSKLVAAWDGDHRPLEFEDPKRRPDAEYDRRYLRQAISRCIGELPPRHREVFLLREIEGRSYMEIAEIAGCNLGTVKSRLNRARNRFAQVIKPLLD